MLFPQDCCDLLTDVFSDSLIIQFYKNPKMHLKHLPKNEFNYPVVRNILSLTANIKKTHTLDIDLPLLGAKNLFQNNTALFTYSLYCSK